MTTRKNVNHLDFHHSLLPLLSWHYSTLLTLSKYCRHELYASAFPTIYLSSPQTEAMSHKKENETWYSLKLPQIIIILKFYPLTLRSSPLPSTLFFPFSSIHSSNSTGYFLFTLLLQPIPFAKWWLILPVFLHSFPTTPLRYFFSSFLSLLSIARFWFECIYLVPFYQPSSLINFPFIIFIHFYY